MQPLLLLILAASPPGGGDPLWWVFFADRGPMAAERVAEAAALLAGTARAERRLAAGAPLASELDLPPWPAYVEEVALLAGSVPRTESRLLDAVSIEADEEEIAAVSCLPFVAGVGPVARSAWTPVSPGPAPAGAENFSAGQLCQAGVGTLIAHGYTGSGTVVGILDTGFNLWHTALADAEILDQYDFLDDDPDPSQQEGDPPGQANHGTAVLSIIAADEPGIYTGGARGASFLLAKTEDTSGEYQQEEDFWVAGLEWLEQEGADLVSSSLGYIDWYGYEDLDGGTAVTTIAADLAASLGMPVVNAIGNNGPAPGTLIAPADGDSVFAVGGVDEAGTLAYFSSRGPTADGRTKPDACAAGVNVVFISPEGQTGYSSGNGTSFATPIVSSAVALLLEAHPEWSSLDALDALRATASQAGAPDDDLGWGIIDADAACRWRSVTGCAVRSDNGDPVTGLPLIVTVAGVEHALATNQAGWFAACPGVLGSFTVTGGGGMEVIPVSGTLDEDGVEVTVYVDMTPAGAGPSAYPSPSSGEVWFGFDLDAASDVEIRVFTIGGVPVWEDVRSGLPAGAYRAPLPGEATCWNGLDSSGEPVSSGAYIAIVRLGGESRLLKFAIIR